MNAVCANVADGKIYVLGGEHYYPTQGPEMGYYTTNATQVYDIATDTWSTKTPIPTPTERYASAVINGKIYVLGGSNANSGLNLLSDMQIYDPASDSWSSAPCQWHEDVAAVATSGVYAPIKLYEIGDFSGYSDNYISNNVIYDPNTGVWSDGAAMPTARSYLGVAIVNDVIYAIGGRTGYNYLFLTQVATVERYIPFDYSGTVSLPSAIPTATPSGSSSPVLPTLTSSVQPILSVNSAVVFLAAAAGVAMVAVVVLVGVLVFRYRRGLAGKMGQAVKGQD